MFNKKIASELAMGVVIIVAIVVGVIVKINSNNIKKDPSSSLETEIRDVKVIEDVKSEYKQIEKLEFEKSQTNPGLSKFDSKLVKLSFSYPTSSVFEESSLSGSIEHVGQNVYFIDRKNISPEFDVVTKNFSVKSSSVPFDIIEGTLETEDSFKVKEFAYSNEYTRIIKMDKGIYWVTGHNNWECSPFVMSYLFIDPPAGSDLKYISFHLGTVDFSEEELDEICYPKVSKINDKINAILNGENKEIKNKFDKALEIAKTFE